ncbi:MAG: ParB/RepB/Spo0J family partition protein [Oscillospiraceae bacterium]|nr:ParB/RepB/Spo0J family partition protein [Oscillospiraceae bacterium]MCD8001804.1 ParB/RepB/Spo0J family partition protein [Oscillospiraceae bacterium]
MAKKGGLGSGLGALFGEDTSAQSDSALMLPITKVEPREDQPRRTFDEYSLAELTDSIQKYGMIQPITVRKIDGDYYQIIAGERRWRAARAAGLTEVPVRILEADDRRAMELALVENLQREDLNPIEEAQGYRTLMDEYGLTQEEAAAAVGKSRPAVTNALRLLSLTAPVLEKVERGELSAGHARALLPIRNAALQLEAAETVITKHLSVRQTETLAARLAAEPAEPKPDSKTISIDYVKEVERELENALGRKIHLVDGRKKGRIEIEFYGAEDREKLIENLKLFATLRRTK